MPASIDIDALSDAQIRRILALYDEYLGASNENNASMIEEVGKAGRDPIDALNEWSLRHNAMMEHLHQHASNIIAGESQRH